MQYRRLACPFMPESIADMRYRYEETDEPQESIAADYSMHRKTLARMAKREGWKLRKDRPPRGVPRDRALSLKADRALREAGLAWVTDSPPLAPSRLPDPPLAAETHPPPSATADGREQPAASDEAAAHCDSPIGHEHRIAVAEELEREIAAQLADVTRLRALGPLPAIDAERTARTLERLTDTLFKVQRLRAVEAGAAAPDNFDDVPGDIDEFRHALAYRIEEFVAGWSDEGLPEEGEPSV